jgi:hypothetical protein
MLWLLDPNSYRPPLSFSPDENPQDEEKAEILSGQLQHTHVNIPFASERDKKGITVESGRITGGGSLAILRQIYFGRFVSLARALRWLRNRPSD